MNKFKHVVSLIMVLAIIIPTIPVMTLSANAASNPSNTEIVYGSNGTITRAEWLHDLSVVFDMSVESDAVPDNYFSDLKTPHPYYNDILLTVEFGVIDVEAGGNVYPDALVTRDFAVTTLNYCLGYQEKEDDVYTFSDSDQCSSPISALIAVERGWLALIGNKFMPERSITSTEAETMLNDAISVLKVSAIDVNHDNKFEFDDDVIVVPEWVYTVETDQTIT